MNVVFFFAIFLKWKKVLNDMCVMCCDLMKNIHFFLSERVKKSVAGCWWCMLMLCVRMVLVFIIPVPVSQKHHKLNWEVCHVHTTESEWSCVWQEIMSFSSIHNILESVAMRGCFALNYVLEYCVYTARRIWS